MKILIVCNIDSNPNPFVPTLAEGIRRKGCEVQCSIDDFWNRWEEYDIIHLQWPDLLIDKGAEELKSNLYRIKKAGRSIVLTCHNLHSHGRNPHLDEMYNIVFQAVDVFVHMGNESERICKEKYPHARHVIIPHHVYNTIYGELPPKSESIKHLNLRENNIHILCMGAFRNESERYLVSTLAKRLRKKHITILAPNYRHLKKWNEARLLLAIRNNLVYVLDKLTNRNIVFHRELVPDNEIPYYYSASDVALIHRNDILNSGNLPMAYLFGKPVIGPSVGNVGEILRETNNLFFTPYDTESVINSVEKLLSNNYLEIGEHNKKIALENWNVSVVAEQYVKLYNSLLL